MPTPTNTQFAVAVHVLTYLADTAGSRLVSSEDLAESTKANPVYVRKVLGPLREAGLVRSRAGAHGGWEAAVDLQEVTLAQVWKLLQGEDAVLGLHGPDPTCQVGRRVQASLLALDRTLANALVAELETVTIRDILTGDIAAPTSPFAQSQESMAR